jgi:uncharacterized protein
MSKYLLLLLIAAVVFGFWWFSRRRVQGPGQATPNIRTIAPCAHCGVHVPADEVVMQDGKAYCSTKHRDLGPPAA